MKHLWIFPVIALTFCGCSSTSCTDTPPSGRPMAVALGARKAIPEEIYRPKERESSNLVGAVDLDLALLLDIALSNSPETRRAWHLASAAAAQRGRSFSAVLPTATVALSVTRQSAANVANLADGPTCITAMGEPSLHIAYTVLTFGATRAAAAAWQNLIGAQFQYNRALQTLFYRVQAAYFALDSAIASMEAREASLCDAVELQNAEEIRLCNGLGSKQSLLMARANALRANGAVEGARANVERARAALAEAVGVRVSARFRIVRSKLPSNVDAIGGDVNAMVSKALLSRQDLLGAYAQWHVAECLEQAAKCAMFPRIALNGDCANTEYWRRGRAKTFALSASLCWDVFSGFDKFFRIMEQRAQRRVAEENLRSAGLRAAGEVWSQYYAHLSAHRQLISARALIVAAKESFAAAETAYRSGLCSFMDILSAQNALASARESIIAAENAFSTSLAALAYAVGDLSVAN